MITGIAAPADKQLQRTVIRRRGRAASARHFIMRLLRAGQCSARPLNCGVRPQNSRPCLIYANGVYVPVCLRSLSHQVFQRLCSVYLDDDEYAELQQYMMENPEAGQLVRGSGGVRKLRWVRPGIGKRGGLRVIDFVQYEPNEFWMLSLYAKARQENVPGHILRQLLEAFRNG